MPEISHKYKKVDLPKAFALLQQIKDAGGHPYLDRAVAKPQLMAVCKISSSLANRVIWHFNNGWS